MRVYEIITLCINLNILVRKSILIATVFVRTINHDNHLDPIADANEDYEQKGTFTLYTSM